MVKGISKQVIVVQSPDPKLFEQAIFILKEGAVGGGITDEILLKEAKALLHSDATRSRNNWGPALWALGGAMLTGFVWLLSWLL